MAAGIELDGRELSIGAGWKMLWLWLFLIRSTRTLTNYCYLDSILSINYI